MLDADLDLDPPLAAIHADWRRAWAPALPDALREAVLSDDRLAARVGSRIAASLAPSLSPAARAAPEREDCAAYLADPGRAVWIAGLMPHAWAISRCLAGEAVRALSRTVPVEDLVLVVEHRDLVQDSDEPADDLALDRDAVIADGQSLVRGWAATLPSALERRIAVTLPRATGPKTDPDPAAARIVAAVLAVLRGRTEGMPS